jgi:hypothetical protein
LHSLEHRELDRIGDRWRGHTAEFLAELRLELLGPLTEVRDPGLDDLPPCPTIVWGRGEDLNIVVAGIDLELDPLGSSGLRPGPRPSEVDRKRPARAIGRWVGLGLGHRDSPDQEAHELGTARTRSLDPRSRSGGVREDNRVRSG